MRIKVWNFTVLFSILYSIPRVSLCEELDSATADALKKTQQILKEESLRNKEATSPEAKQSLDEVQRLGGDKENTEAIFSLSAEILGDLVKQSGGDSVKLQQLIAEAQQNPKAFMEKLTPSQKANLKSIAEKSPLSKKALP